MIVKITVRSGECEVADIDVDVRKKRALSLCYSSQSLVARGAKLLGTEILVS